MMEQKALYRFIKEGYFERHLNKMRNVYKRKREVLVKAITEIDCGIEILGADAGLHLLLHISNGMTEEELIFSALSHGVKVYGISKYYFDKTYLKNSPTLLLGFATMTENEIVKAVAILKDTWF